MQNSLTYMKLGNFAEGGMASLSSIVLGDGTHALLRELRTGNILNFSQHGRFRFGTKVRAALSPHPNIVNSLEFGYHGIRPYEIIELVEGQNLKAMVNSYSESLQVGNDDEYSLETVENPLETGSLTIHKNVFVDGGNKTAEYADRTFYVTVMGTVSGENYWVADAEGKLIKAETGVTPKVFEIHPGTPFTITGLSMGEYTVTEVANANGDAISEDKLPGGMGRMNYLLLLSHTGEVVTVTADDPDTEETETAEVTLVNVYTTARICIAVTKQWVVNGEVYADGDLELTVKLERSIDGVNWESAPVRGGITDTEFDAESGTIVLNRDNNWSAVAIGMEQMDEDGNGYSYRWVEGDHAGWAEAVPETVQHVDVGGDGTVSTLIILTKLINSKVDAEIPVLKTLNGEFYEGTFTFTLTEDENANPVSLGTSAPCVVLQSAGDGIRLAGGESNTFVLTGFSKPGSYTYTIRETEETGIPGMSYDEKNPKTVVIAVGWNEDETFLEIDSVTADGTELGEGGAVEFINSYEPEKVTVEGEKIWVGDEDLKDVIRPESIVVTLYADGVPLSDPVPLTVTPDDKGVWKYSFGELPRYRIVTDEASGGRTEGVEIVYTVDETIVPDETAALYTKEIDGFTVTNTLNRGALKILKTVTVDGSPAELTDAEKEKLTFTVTTAIGGKTYYVVYDTSTTGEDGSVREKWATLTETKITFSYSDFIDGMLTLEHLPVGEYTVRESGGNVMEGYAWSGATVKVGPEGDLTAMEEGASSLSADAEVTSGDLTQVFFANEYTRETGPLTVTKKVEITEGSDPIDGSKTFRIAVYSEDEEGTRTYYAMDGGAVTEESRWVMFSAGQTVTWQNLPVGIMYYVEEDEEGAQADGYELGITNDGSKGVKVVTPGKGEDAVVTITNTYNQEPGSLRIIKTFEGTGELTGEALAKLDSLAFEILGPDGRAISLTYRDFTRSEDGTGGYWQMDGLPAGPYIVRETNARNLIAGYSLQETSVTAGAVTVISGATKEISLNNIYSEDLGSLMITKVFVGVSEADSEDLDDLMVKITGPEGFGETTVYYRDFTDGVYTLEGIPTGQYEIEELNADGLSPTLILSAASITGGVATVAAGTATPVTLVNIYSDADTGIAVAKVWNDMKDLDGSRPESLKVYLLADGKRVKDAEGSDVYVTLSKDNDWTSEITGLPLFDGHGRPIVYSWEEEPVPGYTGSFTQAGNATVIVNTHNPERTTATVMKVWDDHDDRYHLRPVVLKVTLSTGDTYTLSAENNWTVTVYDLPVYVDGVKQVYTWSEQTVLGYTLVKTIVTGEITTFVNRYRPHHPYTPPHDEEFKPTVPIQVIINHVGDCYD